jgi:hypothetical protein
LDVTGFAQGMDASLVAQLVEEVKALKLQVGALQRPNDHPVPDNGDLSQDIEEEEDPFPVTWDEVIQPKTVVPSTPEGARFVKLLSNPPPLQDLKGQAPYIPRYSGVPETPPPRRNKVDATLCQTQHKMEYAMRVFHLEGRNAFRLPD